MPVWVLLCGLGWMVSGIVFVVSLLLDIFRWVMAWRRQRRRM